MNTNCPYCKEPKHGGRAREEGSPCETCDARIQSVQEISPSSVRNNVFLIAAEYATGSSERYYLFLQNNGCFSMYKTRCQIGIGGREMDPDVETLNDLWRSSTQIAVSHTHGACQRRWEAFPYTWPRDYWPTEQDIRLAINAHLLFVARFPDCDLPPQ